jgi:hypothetical protein
MMKLRRTAVPLKNGRADAGMAAVRNVACAVAGSDAECGIRDASGDEIGRRARGDGLRG